MSILATKPIVKQLVHPGYTEPIKRVLDNGVEVFVFPNNETEIVKLQISLEGGNVYGDVNQIPSASGYLLTEGTKLKSSRDISDILDYYGASIKGRGFNESLMGETTCLSRHLVQITDLLREILLEATYPENELQIYKERSKQNLSVKLEKVEELSGRRFREMLFGENNPYGYNSSMKGYDDLNQEKLLAYYKKFWSGKKFTILYGGHFSEESFHILNSALGQMDVSEQTAPKVKTAFPENSRREEHVLKPAASQSSLDIGCILPGKDHEDMIGMNVLNTIFGGYFGSRLMTNIREEKGFTYGIYSYLSYITEASAFQISSEVGADVTKAALTEIYKEIDILSQEKVGQQELDKVRNYILGGMIRKTDSFKNKLEHFYSLWRHGLDRNYFDKYIDVVQTITADELQDLAQKYLQKENMLEVVAGA